MGPETGPALLVGDVLTTLHEPADDAAGHDAGTEAEGQIHAHGEGHHLDAYDLHHDGNAHAGEDQSPRQFRIHNAFYQHLHHGSLGSGDLLAAELPGGVHQVQHKSDDGSGSDDADDLADLLLLGGGAQNEAGLQVLRAVTGDSGDDADDTADADGTGHAGGAHDAGDLQEDGGDDGGDGHAGHRVIGGADEAHHPGGHGGEEEAEDHHDQSTQQIHGECGQQSDGHGDDRRRDGRGDGHTNLQTQVGICCTKDDGQQNADEDGRHRKFRDHTVSRYIRLKVAVFGGHS